MKKNRIIFMVMKVEMKEGFKIIWKNARVLMYIKRDYLSRY